MPAYSIRHDTSYQILAVSKQGDVRKVPRFNGKSIQDSWQDIPVSLITEDFDVLGVDFPRFLYSGVLVCSATAWKYLKNLLEDSIESFRLNCTDGEFYALNVLNVVNCLDLSRSEFTRFKSGRIDSLQRTVFIAGCYGEKPIFKIPERLLTSIFVTDAFKEIVEQNELKGLIFRKIEE